MQATEQSAAPKTEQLAHTRPAVERWLTWSGLIPLPVFLLLHLAYELSRAFSRDISDLERQAPSSFGVVTVALLVWAPLTVHAGLGLWLLVTRRSPARAALDVAPSVRLLSRIASLVALVFLLHHTQQFALATWLGEASRRDAGFRLVAQLSSTTAGAPLLAAGYLLGLLATLAHAGLAAHRGLLAEGLLSSAPARARSARACAALATLLFALGAAAVIRVASGALFN